MTRPIPLKDLDVVENGLPPIRFEFPRHPIADALVVVSLTWLVITAAAIFGGA